MKRKRYVAIPCIGKSWGVLDRVLDYFIVEYDERHPYRRAAALAEAKRLNERRKAK